MHPTTSRRHFLHVAAALLTAPLLPRAPETPRAVSEGLTMRDDDTLVFSSSTRGPAAAYTEFWSLDSGPLHVWPGDEVMIKKIGRYAGSYKFVARRSGVIEGVAFTIVDEHFIVSPLYRSEEEPSVIEMEDVRT